MPTDSNRVRDVFLGAVELSPEQRPEFLAQACGESGASRAAGRHGGDHLGALPGPAAGANRAKEAGAKEQARAAEAARAEGERRAKVEAQRARDNEVKERGYAEAIAKFVKDDFLALTSVEGQGRFGGQELTKDATLRDLLDRAARKLNARKDLDPRIEAELCWIIGVSYRGVGEFERAMPFLERSLKRYGEALGPDGDATLSAQNSLAVAYEAAGKLDRGVPLLEKSLQKTRAKRGPDDPDTFIAMGNLAAAYRTAGNLNRAVPLCEETLKLTTAKLGPENPLTLRSMVGLARAYQDAGKLNESLPLCEEALKLTCKRRCSSINWRGLGASTPRRS